MFNWFKPEKRVLEPHERISEVLFGLIMVLTFTGSLSVAEAGREDVRTMLIGALGCNIAWGLIDGVLYMMGSLAEKGRALATLRGVRKLGEPSKAHKLIASALPPLVASIMKPEELESIRERLSQLPEPSAPARLQKSDWLGALGVFLLVFLTTLPVTIPFIFINNARTAMRVSNAVAIAMLFIAGMAYGRCVGRSAKGFGFGMVLLGAILVGLTICSEVKPRMRKAVATLVLSLVGCGQSSLSAEDAPQPQPAPASSSKFRSPDDGWLDISGFLDEKYGFLPVVLPITEPAVGYGAAAGLAFISSPLGDAEAGHGRPNITMVGGLATENGSRGVSSAMSAIGWMMPANVGRLALRLGQSRLLRHRPRLVAVRSTLALQSRTTRGNVPNEVSARELRPVGRPQLRVCHHGSSFRNARR